MSVEKEPKNNMQTSRLPTRKFTNAFIKMKCNVRLECNRLKCQSWIQEKNDFATKKWKKIIKSWNKKTKQNKARNINKEENAKLNQINKKFEWNFF